MGSIGTTRLDCLMKSDTKVCVSISEVKRLRRILRDINKIPFKNIIWLNDERKPAKFSQKDIDDWEQIGLNNTDFIEYHVEET